MLGSGIGKLSVLVKNNDGSDQRIVWEKSGEQGNEWKQASVEVTSSVSYQVRTMNTVFPRISTHATIGTILRRRTYLLGHNVIQAPFSKKKPLLPSLHFPK